MLVGMVVGSAGTVTERFNGAVIPAFPAINILPVCFIFNGSFCDTKFFGVFNKR